MKETFRKIWRLVKKRKRKWRRVVQGHHISYDPEILVKVYKGEHWIMHQLTRRTHITVGFIVSLRKWLKENEQRAIDLSKGKKDSKLLEEYT